MASADVGSRHRLLGTLREELALEPGRWRATLRITVCCSVVVALTMLHHIPLAASAAYVVFLIMREDSTSTLLTGIVGAIAATVSVALAFVCYMLDAAEPALRLPLMALTTFAGMFCARSMTIGPAAFLGAYVLVMSQTLVDRLPNLEALTRLLLWLWVVAMLPATLTVLADLACGDRPGPLARRSALHMLRSLVDAFRHPEASTTSLRKAQTEAVRVVEWRRRADILDRDLRGQTAVDLRLFETLGELLSLTSVLPANTPVSWRRAFADACETCATAFERNEEPESAPFAGVLDTLGSLPRDVLPVVVAIVEALGRLRQGLVERLNAADERTAPRAGAKSLFLPGAFRDPAHVQFALKSTVAVMSAYVVYEGLDWQGINTAVTTCFFVALGSLGETMHKLTLRIIGASIGGLAAGLSITFLLPWMSDIGDLCLLVGAGAAVSAWVATSGELLSYAGMQMAFAFFTGILQGYGPTAEYTVLRDRIIGILLGNLLVAVVFSVVWPTSARTEARRAIAKSLTMLAELLTRSHRPDDEEGTRVLLVRRLVLARRYCALAAFELRMLAGERDRNDRAEGLDVTLARLAGAVFVVVGQPERDTVDSALLRLQDADAAKWFSTCASAVSNGTHRELPPLEATPSALEGPASSLAPEGSGPLTTLERSAVDARTFLLSEIEKARANQF